MSSIMKHGIVKRIFDISLSSTGLALSFPLWIVIGIAIVIEDGLPVFYYQRRQGKWGRCFNICKFRTMFRGAEKENGPTWAAPNDGRVTRVGRFLRSMALDELPQLLNILKGEMSFVGPRPERPEFVERFRQEIPQYDSRHLVRPGLTGMAQVFGRYDTTPQNKLRYDILYIRRWSLCLDMRLVALSIFISLTGQWESRGRRLRRQTVMTTGWQKDKNASHSPAFNGLPKAMSTVSFKGSQNGESNKRIPRTEI